MAIPDLTDLEKSIIQQSINERWRKGGVVAEEDIAVTILIDIERSVVAVP